MVYPAKIVPLTNDMLPTPIWVMFLFGRDPIRRWKRQRLLAYSHRHLWGWLETARGLSMVLASAKAT
jgi:hypothetical protein